MRKIKHKDIIVCPYCRLQFKCVYVDNDKLWGKAVCSCDEFPFINGIYYLLRDDQLLNRRAVELIFKNKKYKALSLLLFDLPVKIKFCIYFIDLLKRRLSITPPLNLLLFFFESILPNKSWFRYLRKRGKLGNLDLPLKVYKDLPNNLIVDIGCGIGSFLDVLKRNIPKFKCQYFGIDKSLFSLFISRLYNSDNNSTLICADIDCGIPFKRYIKASIFFIDSFWHIKNKPRLLTEFSYQLKPGSQLAVIYMYPTNKVSKYWGYGASSVSLNNHLTKLYRRTVFFENKLTKSDDLKPIRRLSTKTSYYSCYALK